MGGGRIAYVMGVRGWWVVRGGGWGRGWVKGGAGEGGGGRECGRGEWNSRGNGGMGSYREEDEGRRRVSGTLLTLWSESVGSEQD